MERWEVPNTGEIEFELLRNYKEDQITIRDLLKTMILGIANRSKNYYELTGRKDHVFINSESELHASITPAIQELTPIYKTEFPVLRPESKSKGRGHLDYWIFYNNLSFAVEMKFCHKGAYKNDVKISDSIFKKYNEALKQITNIEQDRILQLMDNTKAIVKIVFETIVYDSSANRIQKGYHDNLEIMQKRISNQFEELIQMGQKPLKGFNDTVDFKSLWFLDEDLIFLQPGREVKASVYPAVGFIGHIDYIKC